MDDQEFQDVIKTIGEDHARVVTLIKNMPPLTEEQKQEIAETLTRQKREYDEFLQHHVAIKSKGELAQGAWKAARQAIGENDTEYWKFSQSGSWRNMWIALAIIGAILFFLKLRFP
jgi:hypothetical protein